MAELTLDDYLSLTSDPSAAELNSWYGGADYTPTIDMTGFYNPQLSDWSNLLSGSTGSDLGGGFDLGSLGLSPSTMDALQGSLDLKYNLDPATAQALQLEQLGSFLGQSPSMVSDYSYLTPNTPQGPDYSLASTENVIAASGANEPITLPDGSVVYKDESGQTYTPEQWDAKLRGMQGIFNGIKKAQYDGSGITPSQRFSDINPELKALNERTGLPSDPNARYYFDKTLASYGSGGLDDPSLQRYYSDTNLRPGQEGYLQEVVQAGSRDNPNMAEVIGSTPEGRAWLLRQGAITPETAQQLIAAGSGNMGLGVDGSNSKETILDKIRAAVKTSNVRPSSTGTAKQVANQKTGLQASTGALMMLAQAMAAMQKRNQKAAKTGPGAQAMSWVRK